MHAMAKPSIVNAVSDLADVVEPPTSPAVKTLPAAPEGWSYQTETLPLAGPGDTLPAGVGQVIARDVCEAIKVVNYGTVDLIVEVGVAKNPPDLIGPGVAIVPPGGVDVLQMPSRIHAFYGRAGELVGVTRYVHAQPPYAGRISDGLWHPVDLGPVATSVVGYTTPWGTRATFGGFTARETGETDPVTFKFRDGDASGGVLLEDVTLGPRGSTEANGLSIACTTNAIYVEFLGGGGTLELCLRVR